MRIAGKTGDKRIDNQVCTISKIRQFNVNYFTLYRFLIVNFYGKILSL